MATNIEPAGAASAALNTQTRAVQQPPQAPVRVDTETTRPASSSGDVAQTSQVNPNSRLGNYIDTTA